MNNIVAFQGVLVGALIVATGCSSLVPSQASVPAGPARWRSSAVSGLPLPDRGPVAEPSKSEAPLTVLDWAGFDGAASYSFDDTQPSQVAHWPQLRDTGVRMTFYAWSETGVSAPDTWKDVVAHGSELGNHTVTHKHIEELAARYPGNVAEAATRELDECDAFIVSMGQPGVWTMAYPYGDLGWRRFLAGRYLAARSVSNGMVPATGSVAFDVLPTFAVTAGQNAATFNAVLDGAADAQAWVVFTFHALLPTSQNWYAGVEVSDVVASLDYGKDRGRLWLDSVVNVAAYRRAADWLREPPLSHGATKTWTWALPANFPRGKYLRVTSGGTLTQDGVVLRWNAAGFYEVALDAGSLTWTPKP